LPIFFDVLPAKPITFGMSLLCDAQCDGAW